MSTSTPTFLFIWFLLLDSTTGEPYKGTSAAKVSISLPFALLTNATDYWHFSWLSKNNTMKSIVLKNPRQGLAALKEGLQMMNGKRGKCPFKDRMNFLVPEIGRGGETYTDDVGNMEDFYDEMTEEDIFNYKIKRGFTRMFDAMNPTLRESFKVK